MAELAELSPSNPIVRRHELITRMRGFENLANKHGDCGLFFTLTCPSKFHWLNVVWQRTRAAWAREGITPYGMRTVEPHNDGTPHWHLMLLMPPDQAKHAAEIFRDYALAEDGDEPSAEKYLLKVIEIDPTKGSATGYIAK